MMKGREGTTSLASAPPSATTPDPGVRAKSDRRIVQGRRDVLGGGGIVGLDIRDDLLNVGNGPVEPEDIHTIRS